MHISKNFNLHRKRSVNSCVRCAVKKMLMHLGIFGHGKLKLDFSVLTLLRAALRLMSMLVSW